MFNFINIIFFYSKYEKTKRGMNSVNHLIIGNSASHPCIAVLHLFVLNTPISSLSIRYVAEFDEK